ncbi:6179_t:CDS:2, partial [Entrophospora sp. SA101]
MVSEDDSDKHKIFDPFEKHSDLGGPKTLLLVDNKEKWVDVDQITPIVNNKEQWVDRNNYEKTSAFIDENQSLQLFIGLTTVQIWRKVTDESPILEYIWTLKHVKNKNNNDVEIENHDGYKHLKIKNLRVGCRKFELEVTWEDYVYDLFYKECFTDNNIGTNFKLFLDKELTDNSIGINFKLKEDTESNLLQNSVKKIPFKKIAFGKDNQNRANETKEKTAQKAEGKNKHNTVPFNLCVVPLPNFTVNKIEKKNVQKNVVIACLRHLILPYKYIGDEIKLSSFTHMINLDRKGLIFDNPAIEALINFRWRPAKIYFLLLFFTFIQYAVCYGILIWAYTTHQNNSNNLRNFLILVMGYFYFTGYRLLSTEFTQLRYYKSGKYFSNKYNILDIIAIIVPLIVETTIIVKSFEIEDAFGSVKPDQGTIAAISFSMLFLWIEFVNDIGLAPSVNTYSIVNTTTNQTVYNDITIKADFNSTSSIDNPFSNFWSSIPAAYFWMGGNWINKDTYGSYFAVQILSLIASLLIVIIIQNMFITFVSIVYEKTSQESKVELLRLQAAFILEFDALDLDDFLNSPKPDPKYICHNNNNLDAWKERTKSRRGCLYAKYENENSYIQYVLEKKDFDHQAGSLWQFHKGLDDFNDD